MSSGGCVCFNLYTEYIIILEQSSMADRVTRIKVCCCELMKKNQLLRNGVFSRPVVDR